MKTEVTSNLHRRFAIWGMAIASSLVSTGFVNLRTADAWYQGESEQANSDDAKVEKLTQAAFSKLLSAGKMDEIEERLDAALAETPLDAAVLSMDLNFSARLSRSAPEKSTARLTRLLEIFLSMPELDARGASNLSMAVNYAALSPRGDASVEEKAAMVRAAFDKILAASDQIDVSTSLGRVATIHSQLLKRDEKTEEANDWLHEKLQAIRESTDADDVTSLRRFTSLASSYAYAFDEDYPDQAQEIMGAARELIDRRLASKNVTVADFQLLQDLTYSTISGKTYSDPKSADAMLKDVEEKLANVKSRFENELKNLERSSSRLKTLRTRIEQALAREEMIGQPAPELQAEAFVGMDETTLEELKGKVVLLDFWAVWCGPCIATFPHLIEWHEEFAEDGLVIIGATRQYNYKWDEETGKAARQTEDVELDDELAMLEKFRESHELHHGFVVTPKDGSFTKEYLVSGIPQAVLIDKAGNVRMIKVGSGPASAKALHDMIEELLTE